MILSCNLPGDTKKNNRILSHVSQYDFNAEMYSFTNFLSMAGVLFSVQRSFLTLILTQMWAWW